MSEVRHARRYNTKRTVRFGQSLITVHMLPSCSPTGRISAILKVGKRSSQTVRLQKKASS